VVEAADEGVMEVYVEAGSRVELNCSIQGTANISWSRPQGSISRNSERKGVSGHQQLNTSHEKVPFSGV
jgi:hypothetical protein